ncbi:MAG: DUF1365 domain-containing protein [Acidimicrobiia bacterium]
MSETRSRFYEGRVRHTRLRPVHHDFTYRVFYGLFDIDELDRLDLDLRWFSVGRFNLLSFDPDVHGAADGTPLRPWVETTLREAGVELEGGPVRLLAFPRILGYVFDPISIWYCHGPDEDLRAVIYEVRNTFGDRHSYVVPVAGNGMTHEFAKKLHVSPFNGMDESYRFTITPPARHLSVSIEQRDRDGSVTRAGMRLTETPFRDSTVVRLFLTHPLLTLKVIGAIHWQALLLGLKGAKFHRRPDPGSHSISIIDSRSVVN